MDWKSVVEWARSLVPVLGGIASLGSAWVIFRAGWWKARLNTSEWMHSAAEKRCGLLEKENADLQRRHAAEMNELRVEYDRLVAENADMRTKLAWDGWKPEPPNPFAG